MKDLLDKIDVEFAYVSDRGVVRQRNEDYVHCENNVCVLADGLGRRYNGEQASSNAVKVIFDKMNEGSELSHAISDAHHYISGLAVDGVGMGTTVVACEFSTAGYKVAWVGDSRAYLWESETKRLLQLTDDHSLVNQWVKQGQLTQHMAQQHPQRNVLTQCLGLSDTNTLQIDARSGYFHSGQIMLLCSDGLTNLVSERVIGSILEKDEPLESMAQELITKANDLGGIDNVSVALARLK